MALENLPVWRFPPNWSDDLVETLEWMTDILTSPTGAEQRRALRIFPRRFYEFEILLEGRERSLFDNLMITHGGHDWYLPLWHDTLILASNAGIDASSLIVPDALNSWLQPGGIAFIAGRSAFEFELVEIQSLTSVGITLVGGTSRTWPAGTLVYPVVKGRLVEQPELSKLTDKLAPASVKFRSVSPQVDAIVGSYSEIAGDSYRGFQVLTVAPDEAQTPSFDYARLLEELDNQTGIPAQVDTAKRTFVIQQYRWQHVGRDEHKQFERFLYAMRGRAVPFYSPTFFTDFELASPIAANASAATVLYVGFAESGGPRDDRRDIRILMNDGTRYYRRITGAAISGANEVLALDAPLPVRIDPLEVAMISFISLMRFDQDSFEISHTTDVDGVSSVSTMLRSAPDLRQATSAFAD